MSRCSLGDEVGKRILSRRHSMGETLGERGQKGRKVLWLVQRGQKEEGIAGPVGFGGNVA